MKKTFDGKVVSAKMQKTVIVEVERKFRHVKYQKVIVRHSRFKAHNELEKINVGDMVRIEESKPISKDVHFIVKEKVKNKLT